MPTLLVPHLVLAIWQVQVPIRTLGREHNHADDTTRATVPPDSLLQRALDKVHRLRFLHTLLPVVVAVTVDVCRTGPADRVRTLVQRATQGNAVYLTTMTLVPSSNNETGAVKSIKSALAILYAECVE